MDIVPEIDWAALSFAVSYYKTLGYMYVEVPWMVPSRVNMLTCPHESLMMKITGTSDALVGSAEQSFLKLDLDGLLPPGKYVACSPCFRIEDANDGWHFPTFMKVELYRTDNPRAETLFETIKDAESFFDGQIRYTPGRQKTKVTRTSTLEGIDLMINGIEVGSYGIRARGDFKWVYGTGLALPRFSQAMKIDV